MHGCKVKYSNHSGCPSTRKTETVSIVVLACNTRAHYLLLMRTTRNFQKVREKRMDVHYCTDSTTQMWELNSAWGLHISIGMHTYTDACTVWAH